MAIKGYSFYLFCILYTSIFAPDFSLMGGEQAPEDEINGKDRGGLVHASGEPEPLKKNIWKRL